MQNRHPNSQMADAPGPNQSLGNPAEMIAQGRQGAVTPCWTAPRESRFFHANGAAVRLHMAELVDSRHASWRFLVDGARPVIAT